jgi:phosphonoacetaldehyde hydrolase
MDQSPDGVRAVIFDISGTTLDFGSRGPVVAFVELFARHGIALTEEEARRPMGTHKLDHIWTILSDPFVAAQWTAVKGAPPTPDDLQELYREFTPLQIEVLPRHCDIIPGVPFVVGELRERGIKIANTTGFDTAMIGDLTRLAAEGGYTPDLWVCPDMVGKGRPAPWMAFHVARVLDVYPMRRFVKVGDTIADVQEAHAAGMWAVSVVRHGNEVGLSQEALDALAPDEAAARFRTARERLGAAGPHYIIDATVDLTPVVDEISERIAAGERP